MFISWFESGGFARGGSTLGQLRYAAKVLLVACLAGTAPFAHAAALSFQQVTTAVAGFDYIGASWTVAWGDANGDALPDLYFSNHGARHNLFLNKGTGAFAEAPAAMFNPMLADTHGAAWADIDNDGDEDLVELVGADRGTSTGKSNRLFVNEGGALTDRGVERGVQDPLGRGRTPLWFDWDRDGFLDLLVLNADRAEAPSVLFRNNHGFFSRTNAVDIQGFTKYAVLGSLASGERHVVVSGYPSPTRIYDAHQVNPLPMTNLRDALGITPGADVVADTVLLDANGDGVDDILEIKGQLSSDADVGDGSALRARIVLDDTGGTRGFRFNSTAPVTLHIAPLWSGWWSTADVFIGRSGWHPNSMPVQLSAASAAFDGLMSPTAAKGIYIGYDRMTAKWEVRVVGTGRQEANFVARGGVLSGLERIGFMPVARLAPALLASRDGRYYDTSAASGLMDPGVASNCFSATAADFDNDGDLDVFAACSGPIGRGGIANQLLQNNGFGRFSVLPGAGGVAREDHGVADGVAAADYDLDGFVDLALTNGQGPYPFNDGHSQLFRNTSREGGNLNHWLQIDLRGVQSNRDGVGARIRLTAAGKTQTRMQRNGVHSGSQDFSRIHFGLGTATRVSSIEVEWPSGARQLLSDVGADQVIRLVEGRGASPPFALAPVLQGYGSQTTFTRASRRFTLRNISNLAQPLRKLGLMGVDAGQFAATHTCGNTLAVGATCAVDVALYATATGWKNAQLMVVAGDKYIETARLTANAVPAKASLAPTSTAFGSVRVGMSSLMRAVTVKNTGASVLPVRSVTLEGVNPGQFLISSGCPQYLAVAQSCTVRVAFKPTGTGFKSAQLVVSPGKSGSRQVARLAGTGV